MFDKIPQLESQWREDVTDAELDSAIRKHCDNSTEQVEDLVKGSKIIDDGQLLQLDIELLETSKLEPLLSEGLVSEYKVDINRPNVLNLIRGRHK